MARRDWVRVLQPQQSPGIAPLRAAALLSAAPPQNGLVRGFGGCAASHVEGTGPARAFHAILVGSPWVVVTVPALVLCARLLGWSRESATTSLVTGPILIQVERLQIFPSLPPPRLSLGLFPASGGHYDTL